MKKELNINGAIYRLVEEESKLEVGKWYKVYCYNFLNLGDGKSVGFFNDVWHEADDMEFDPNLCQPADIKEVKELLIEEAEKRGFKEGVKITRGWSGDSECVTSYENLKGIYVGERTGELQCFGVQIFDSKTGKWAEIINEPLYINQYGTEFFEGG